MLFEAKFLWKFRGLLWFTHFKRKVPFNDEHGNLVITDLKRHLVFQPERWLFRHLHGMRKPSRIHDLQKPIPFLLQKKTHWSSFRSYLQAISQASNATLQRTGGRLQGCSRTRTGGGASALGGVTKTAGGHCLTPFQGSNLLGEFLPLRILGFLPLLRNESISRGKSEEISKWHEIKIQREGELNKQEGVANNAFFWS